MIMDKDFTRLCAKANKGDAEAQVSLGLCYYHGDGTEQDMEKAKFWFQKATEQGNISALFHLGNYYYYQEKDRDQGAQYWKQAAKQGHLDAKYNLGVYYFNSKKQGTAIDTWTAAAEAGNLDAQLALGKLYSQPTIGKVKPNWKKAFVWYLKAAEQEDSEACFQVSKMYRDGKGTQKNLLMSISWLTRAALEEHAVAQFELGLMLYNKFLNEDDESALKRCIDLWKDSAEQGNVEAQYSLATTNVVGNLDFPLSPEESLEWLKKAMAQGHMPSRLLYTQYLFEGSSGVERNPKESVRILKELIEENYAPAFCILGICYHRGEGVDEKDDCQAFTYFKKSAQLGYPNAYYYQGLSQEYGMGTEIDPDEAFLSYMKGSELEDGESIFRFCLCCITGTGCEKNDAYAKRFAMMSAEEHPKIAFLYEHWDEIVQFQNNLDIESFVSTGLEEAAHPTNETSASTTLSLPDSAEEKKEVEEEQAKGIALQVSKEEKEEWEEAFSDLTTNGKSEKSLEKIHTLAKQGNILAIESLAEFYLLGKFVEKDEEKGIQLLEYAIELGDFSAKEFLAVYYFKDSVDKKELGIKLLREIEDVSSTAKALLGLCYLHGFIGIEEDIPKAISMLQEAAKDENCEEAFIGLGICYMEGRGMPQDFKKAFAFFSKVKLAIERKAYFLGLLYLDGKGVEKDVKKAKEYFLTAEKEGYIFAKHELGCIAADGLDGEPANLKLAYQYWNEIVSSDEIEHTETQYRFGRLLIEGGKGIRRNTARGKKLLQAAKEQGYPEAIEYCEQLGI